MKDKKKIRVAFSSGTARAKGNDTFFVLVSKKHLNYLTKKAKEVERETDSESEVSPAEILAGIIEKKMSGKEPKPFEIGIV